MRSFLLIYRFNGHGRFFYRGTKTPEDENREQVETSGLETEATLHTYMDIPTFCICVKDPESRLWQTDV